MVRFWKFTPIAAASAAILLLIAAVLIGVYAERDYRDQKIQQTTVQAEIVARAVAAALAFNEGKAASAYVNALRENNEIMVAAIYDGQGRLFASFLREGAAALPERVQVGSSYGDLRVSVAVPVVQRGVSLGTVYLRAVTRSLMERVTRYIGVMLLGGMVAIVLVVLALAQRALNRANAELRERAAELEQANTALRGEIAERERTEEALRQAQKMESIGRLTGGVAHDFNNLLAIIVGNLERLERQVDQGVEAPRMQRAIASARAGAERATVLTRSLLAFSRRQPLQPQPVEVNRLVNGMSELLRRTLGEQIEIETVVAGGLWRTLVDPNQLENAVLNLAVNARDAMPRGGKLTIETANTFLDGSYTKEYQDLAPGQYVVLCITDTGTGMSREVMENAFEPFFTTKDVSHGTGLGLSQVYGLVKQSGGHVKIYSEAGEGTTIKIYLPRLVSEEEPAAPRPVVPEPATAPGEPVFSGHVLIVEDDDGVRAHSAEILAEFGLTVFQATNGADALRILDEERGIALLFTDVGLPGGMNGRQLAEEAQRRRPDLPVLYTTGYARNAIVHDGRLDAGVHLVLKPFTRAELADAVRAVLRTEAPKVLVVEDEFLLMVDTTEHLAEFGCVPVEATTAAEARAVLERLGGQVAAAIVDLGLPDQKGDGLVMELREKWPGMPVIVASGAVAGALRPELAEDPMVRSLAKPYNSAGLRAALKAAGVPVSLRGG